MALTRFDPFRDRFDPWRDVVALQNRLQSLFQNPSRNEGENDLLATAGFVPPVDIYEDEHQVVLKLEIPGIRMEDLDIRVEGNTLTVRGERKLEKEEKEENFHRLERHYGSFYRAFTLPSTVDAEKIKANYENGVLRLEIEKRAEAKPKQIKVNVTPGSGKQIEAAKPAHSEATKKIA